MFLSVGFNFADNGIYNNFFHDNPRFSQKFEIFAKLQDFDENLKIRPFCGNSGFSRKFWIFAKILDFCKNLGFSLKSCIE